MADKKMPPGKGGAQKDSAPEETENLYTLPDLVTRLGDATVEEVGDYIEGLAQADLIEEGADVATSRIDKDTARIYGKAADFFNTATEEQLDALVGVSGEMLRVAAWAALQGSTRAKARERSTAKAGAAKQIRAGEAEQIRAKAVARRKALRAGLRSLAAGDQVLRDAIDTAYGTIETFKTLSDALEALAQIGRKMLKSPTPAMKARLKTGRLTATLLDDTVELAEKVRATGDAAAAVTGTATVSQAEVDYWDGINLFFLSTFIEVFDAGHEVDRTIPRLLPIALRSYFSPRRRSAEPGTPPVGESSKPA